MKIFCDTSIFVAGCLKSHPNFQRANFVLKQAEQFPNDSFCAAHSLAETYATLTRIPNQPRYNPVHVSQVIKETILDHFNVVALDATAYQRVIAQCVEDGLIGGIIYDALIMHCAATVKADRIYTFNVRHFQRALPTLASKVIAP